MKHGIAKSLALEKLQRLVNETLVDAYASLDSVCHAFIRKDDCGRDIDYIARRVEHEGLTFLTVTLPRLGEWFDNWVQGRPVQRVEGFVPYNGLYPVFLRPFWIGLQPIRDRILSWPDVYNANLEESVPQEGLSLCDPATATVIRCVRTVLLGLKKLETSLDPDLCDAKLKDFIGIETNLSEGSFSTRLHPSPELRKAQDVLDCLLSDYYPECIAPKHGPGAVAGGERGLEKWSDFTLYESLHDQWPYYEYLFGVRSSVRPSGCTQGIDRSRSLPLQLAACAREYRHMRRVPEPTARLVFVPKDSRGPRIICCEPKELMYIQQGVARHLMNHLESHSLTKGHVNFADQSINAALALSASRTREWATIDLSDASDRVSCELVRFLLPARVSKKLLALRSTAIQLPDGTVLPIRKFSPMGSALTFPVESMIFWAVAVGCVWKRTNDLHSATRSVYVYGDDIIVKVEDYESVVKGLTEAGLKVNDRKSFTGVNPFRESCGTDAFDGHVVTPNRVKLLPPQRPSDGTAIAAYIKYAENSASWLPRRSATLLSYAEELVGRIPRTPIPQAFLSLVDPSNFWSHDDFRSLEWDSHLCYYTAKLKCLRTKAKREVFPEWFRLQHDLLNRVEGDPSLVVDRSSTLIRSSRLAITYLPWRSEGVRET